jgi:hypothetical protein
MAWNDEFNEMEVCIERVIAYWSRLLTLMEKGYSPTKKETLALRGSLIKFQPLIKGETIAVMTDTFSTYPRLSVTHQMGRVHSSVNPLSRLEQGTLFHNRPVSNTSTADLSHKDDADIYGGIGRKFDTCSILLFAHSDRLSSIASVVDTPISHPLQSLTYSASTTSGTYLHVGPQNVRAVFKGHEKDSHFNNAIESFPVEPPFAFKNHYRNSNGQICFNGCLRKHQLCNSSCLQPGIMENDHGSATSTVHVRFERTYRWIADGYPWPRMTGDIQRIVTGCLIYQKIKHTRPLSPGFL